MQEHNFDEILDFLCSGIMSKRERQNVREELFDHLMCKYETNIAMGMDDEEATEKAINDLGDKTVIRHRLSQVHSYYPNLSMKRAMNLLIFGFCLVSFQLNVFGIGEFTKFIGEIVMLVALFRLSKANSWLKKAFILDFAGFGLSRVAPAIIPALPSEVFWIPHVLYIISCVLGIIKWFYLLYGLRDLTEPFKEEYKKNIPYGFAAFSNVLAPVYLIWLYCAMIVSENSDFGAVDEAAIIIIPIGLLSIIMNLISFVMTSKCLWQNDHEYQIETSSKKENAVAVAAFLIAVLSVVTVDLGVSFEKAETEFYSIDDSNISETEYNRICDVLLSYNIPERLVYSLPESEIERFENAVPSSEIYIPEGYVKKYVDSNDWERYGFSFDTYTCAVGIVDESEIPVFRYMTWIEYGKNIKGHFSDYIQFDIPGSGFLPCVDDDKNADTVLILSEENGKIMKNEPLEVYHSEVFGRVINGIKVQAKDGMLMYVGKNYGGGDMLYLTTYRSINVYHKILPLTTMRNVPDISRYYSDALGIVPFRVSSKNWIALKDNVNLPEETDTEETE